MRRPGRGAILGRLGPLALLALLRVAVGATVAGAELSEGPRHATLIPLAPVTAGAVALGAMRLRDQSRPPALIVLFRAVPPAFRRAGFALDEVGAAPLAGFAILAGAAPFVWGAVALALLPGPPPR